MTLLATPWFRKLPALAERQIVNHRCHEAVALVENRQAALARQTVGVLREQGVRTQGADAAAVVDGFRKRVAREDRQAVRVTPRDLDGKRMVVGVAAIHRPLDQTELGKGPALRHRRGAENGLVRQVAEALQPVALGAEITHLENRGLASCRWIFSSYCST